MRRVIKRLSLALVAGSVIVAVLAGCGARDDDVGKDFPPRYIAPSDSRYGGELRVLSAGDVDSLDPGLLRGQFAGILTLATQRTLVAANEGTRQGFRADVAERMPEVDRGAGTVDFRLRKDVRFSPPVARPVEAADFKYALERGLMPGIANGNLKLYLPKLRGLAAAERQAAKDPSRAPDIVGIEALGRWHLRLKFNGKVPPLAVPALSMPFAAPVPRGYAARFDREIPSTYGLHSVASGPYMVANDPDGNLTGYEPGVKIELVRNPEWKRTSDFRPAFLDGVQIVEGYSSSSAASNKILNGRSAVNGDFAPEPAMLRRAAGLEPGQLMLVPSGIVLYAALNTTIPPLDDVNVRRAVVAATDREAIQLAMGGKFTGEIASHFIPPGVPGFEEAGGFAGPGFDFLEHPSGDAELAARYMRKAGYPDGRYTGGEKLAMVTSTTESGRRTAEVVRQAFDQLGIPVSVRAVSKGVMYSEFCNRPVAAVAVCPDVGWLQSLHDPQTMFSQTFNGEAIERVNNSNWPQLNDPEVNRAMRSAERLYDPAERARAWGEVDRMVSKLAPAIPNLWFKAPMISSRNVVNVIDTSVAATSLPFTSLKAANSAGGD